jgi:hypothetical protein
LLVSNGLVRGGKDTVANFEAANLAGSEQLRERHIKPLACMIASSDLGALTGPGQNDLQTARNPA